jgi:hypothetical protein
MRATTRRPVVRVPAVERLERGAARKQHAAREQRAARAREHDRRRQGERARAGDDQHRHRDPGVAPVEPCRGGDQHDHPGEMPRDALRGIDQARLAGCAALGQTRDRRGARIRAGAGYAHGQRLLEVDRAADQLVARALRHRTRLAGEQRLVCSGDAFEHHAVGGNALAGRDANGFSSGENFFLLHAQQRIERPGRAALRLGVQVARAEQQEGEHADRVEVDLALPRQRRPGAGGEAEAQAERDRRVEADALRTELAPGAGEERRAGEKQHRKRDEQARPAHQARRLGADFVHVGRERIHHHLHRAERSDEEAPERGAALGALERVLAARLVGAGVVADGADRLDDGRERGALRIPGDLRAPGRVVDADLPDSRRAAQHLLDQPQARGAAHALEDQRGLRAFARRVDRGQRLRAHARCSAGLVVGAETRFDDGAGHGLAAGAAEAAAAGERQAAVKTGTQLSERRHRQRPC